MRLNNLQVYSLKIHKQKMFFIVYKTFVSNVTKKLYAIVNHSKANISCYTSSLIFLPTFSTSKIQYVRETVLPLHKRVDIHGTVNSGREYMIKHFQNDCV